VSAGDVVVDDHLLLRILLGDDTADPRPGDGGLATTGLWYHRLGRALADPTVTGVVSRSLGGVDERTATATVRAVIELPDWIELVSLRTLAWPMADLLASGTRANLLTLEALAVAQHLEAEVCLAETDANPQLLEAAQVAAVPVRLVA
jgi:hypothetical protein